MRVIGGLRCCIILFVLSQVGGEVILSNLSATARHQVHLRKEVHRVLPKKEQAAHVVVPASRQFITTLAPQICSYSLHQSSHKLLTLLIEKFIHVLRQGTARHQATRMHLSCYFSTFSVQLSIHPSSPPVHLTSLYSQKPLFR